MSNSLLGTTLLIASLSLAGCAHAVSPEDLFRSEGPSDAGADGKEPVDPTAAAPDGSSGQGGGAGGTENTGGSGGSSTGGSGGSSTGGSGGSSMGGSGGSSTGGSGGSSTGGSGGSSTGGSGGSSTGGSGGTGGSSSVPSGWDCLGDYYNEGVSDSCDCGCGVSDPDCGGSGCTTPDCYVAGCNYCYDATGQNVACDTGTGGTGGGTWTCNPMYYDEGYSDSCDCGCGIPDPDCGYGGCEDPNCSDASCDYCYDEYGWDIQCGGGSGTGCTNSCLYAGDGWCDDGGPGAEFDVCDYGTDCADCGPR